MLVVVDPRPPMFCPVMVDSSYWRYDDSGASNVDAILRDPDAVNSRVEIAGASSTDCC